MKFKDIGSNFDERFKTNAENRFLKAKNLLKNVADEFLTQYEESGNLTFSKIYRDNESKEITDVLLEFSFLCEELNIVFTSEKANVSTMCDFDFTDLAPQNVKDMVKSKTPDNG